MKWCNFKKLTPLEFALNCKIYVVSFRPCQQCLPLFVEITGALGGARDLTQGPQSPGEEDLGACCPALWEAEAKGPMLMPVKGVTWKQLETRIFCKYFMWKMILGLFAKKKEKQSKRFLSLNSLSQWAGEVCCSWEILRANGKKRPKDETTYHIPSVAGWKVLSCRGAVHSKHFQSAAPVDKTLADKVLHKYSC